MRVLVAGATGVVGRQLVPLLAAAGHDVVALSRRPAAAVDGGRVVSVAVDALDVDRLRAAVAGAAPEAVVDLLTAIPASIHPRRFAADMVTTNRLRTEAASTLLGAGAAAGATRFVSESLAFAYDPHGGSGAAGPADEDEPLWLDPPAQFRAVLAAVRAKERMTVDAGGLVLRFGHLCGPGSAYAGDGSFVAQVRAGAVPLVGGGRSTFSFTHAYDAATAVVASLGTDVTGTLNVVDDRPAPMSAWLPVLAEQLGARRPRSVPAVLARLAVGGWGVAFMTQLRGADNARARSVLGWQPRFPSWRESIVEPAAAAPAAG
jgi:nucleoside-diphosphate-sugar epimerase